MCSLQRLMFSSLLIAASLHLVTAWSTRLKATTVCDDLHVTHNGQNTVPLGRGNVSLVMLKNGREVSCYEPDQRYDVELRSNNNKKMMGVLWILDPVTGDFPLGSAPRNTKIGSVCGNQAHISHYCEDQGSSTGCILGEDGLSLRVGYRAPSLNDLHTLVIFKYTVVFKEHEYLENEKQHFERCPAVTDDGTTTTPEPSTTSEPEPPCSNETPEDNGNQVQPEDNNLTTLNNVDNLTNESGQQHQQCNTFEPNQGAEVASGHCGIERMKSNESRPYTDITSNIDYICTINDEKKYVRKVTCESRCEKNGQQHICRVKNTVERKRQFICRPTSDFPGFGTIYREFMVEQQSQCECFQVNDVELTCPTTRPPVQCPTTTATPTTPPTESNRP